MRAVAEYVGSGRIAGLTHAEGRSRTITAAVAVVAVQGGLLAVTGLAVWALSVDRRRRFAHRYWYDRVATHPRLAGLVFLVVAAGLVVLAIAIARRWRGAPLATYITEGVLVVASLARFHPLRSLLGVGLGVAAIVLVASSRQVFEPASPSRR